MTFSLKNFSLEDDVVVLTGGSGQLGRQYCKALISAGAKVAVFDRFAHADFAQSAQVSFFEADVTSRASLERALSQLEEKWGPPTGLINNAALDSPPNSPAEENGPFESYPEASWDRVMEVNAKGVFLCCQVIGGRMALAGRGSVINIGSIYGVISPDQRIYEYREQNGGRPFFKPVAYSASKSALYNLTRYLATYWAAKGVRVNALTLAGVDNNQDDNFLAGYCPKVPLGRMARPDEYCGAIVFLLSDAASYMTGSNLVVDGGYTAW